MASRGAEVMANAKSNDALARTVLTEAGSYLGIALANTINLLGLRDVVLAGHLAHLSEFLTPGMRQVFKVALWGDVGERVAIRRSQLGADIRLAGSIALAMQSFLPGSLADNGGPQR